jgi:WD40 repeat protein
VASESDVTAHDLAGGDPTEIPLEPDGEPMRGVVASADGSRMVVVRDDGGVELRDTTSGALVIEFDTPVAPADGWIAIAINSDGSRVAYQQGGADVVIADADGTREQIELAPWRRRLQTIALSSSGDELVLSTTAGEAVWYELEGMGARVIAPRGDGFDAQFMSDGRIATVGLNGVQLIDPRQPEPEEQFAIRGDVRRFAVDPTRRLLATVDRSGEVQLWDAEDGVAIGDPLPLARESPPMSIRFSADGRYLVASGALQASWINVSSADWARAACTLVDDRFGGDEVARVLGAVEMSEVCT